MSEIQAETELVRVRTENGAETSVSRSFAESKGLTILTDEDAMAHGDTRPVVYPAVTVALRGSELDDALTDAGLSTSGKLADKQARLAAHQQATGQPAGETTE